MPTKKTCMKTYNNTFSMGFQTCVYRMTMFKVTPPPPPPQNAIRFGHVSSCGTIENHLTLFKERHLLDKDRVDRIFNHQRRRRDAVLVLSTRF